MHDSVMFCQLLTENAIGSDMFHAVIDLSLQKVFLVKTVVASVRMELQL